MIPYVAKQRTASVKQATDRLEKAAKTIPEVKHATAILIGNTAIVGIDLKKKVDRAKADSVKYAVTKALRNEKYGARAIVTADTDMGQRIKNVRDGIIEGRPLASFTNELGDIIGRVAPQMPR
jgi:YhcN/YlaJ family sporulation lipoprotein